MRVSRSVVLAGMWYVFAAWVFSRFAAADHIAPSTPAMKCEIAGTKINAFIAEAQAGGALSEGPFYRGPFTTYSLEQVKGGFLVSLVPAQSGGIVTVGGGGLVWVDGATGCTEVLRRYQ
jgi:hypothetical protein